MIKLHDFTVGDAVEVFNQVSDNWNGVIVALNKKTARVRADCLPSGRAALIFTDHKDARSGKVSDEYLVPFHDLTKKEEK